jgi:hypothetical protein
MKERSSKGKIGILEDSRGISRNTEYLEGFGIKR